VRTNSSLFEESGGVGGVRPGSSASEGRGGDASAAVLGSGGEIWLFDQ
jgi:hypothetical protein